MPSVGYYQIGGFQPSVEWFKYDEKAFGEAVVGTQSPFRRKGQDPDAAVKLILGIKPTGSSHLLMTEDEAVDFARALRLPYPRGRPIVSTAFESLSPIYFSHPDELSKKLSTLKPKSKKGAPPTDHSQANKMFVGGTEGKHRAEFEHGRVFYQLLNNAIDMEDLAVEDASWTESFRLCSLVFNTSAIDERDSSQRLKHPRILDIGWSEADTPGLQVQAGSSKHFVLLKNRFLGEPSKFEWANTEVLDLPEITSQLQELFQPQRPTIQPMILLVHGEEMTRYALNDLGVETSGWESGLKSLLGSQHDRNRFSQSQRSDPRSYSGTDPRARNISPPDSFNSRQHYGRDRSSSPNRRDRYQGSAPASRSSSYRDYPHRSMSSSHSSGGDRDHRSLIEARPSYAPVYVVDVKRLYCTMMQSDHASTTIATCARHLQILNTGGFCAGNEAVLIIDVWRQMISGKAIDEQRAHWSSIILPPPKTPGTAPEPEAAADEDDDDDEDFDPNDIVQVAAPKPSGGDMYADLTDSDYDSADE